eukprot:6944907-Prymnesium_polylepis.2
MLGTETNYQGINPRTARTARSSDDHVMYQLSPDTPAANVFRSVARFGSTSSKARRLGRVPRGG